MARRRAVLLICALLLVGQAWAQEEGDTGAEAPQEVPDFTKMRVKQLQALLDERGVTCSGCSEKEHLVEKVKESFHLPIKPKEEAKPADTDGFPKPDFQYTVDGTEEQQGSESVEEMIKKLRQGMPGHKFQMFNKNKMFGGKKGMKIGEDAFKEAVERAKARKEAAEQENILRAEAQGAASRRRPKAAAEPVPEPEAEGGEETAAAGAADAETKAEL